MNSDESIGLADDQLFDGQHEKITERVASLYRKDLHPLQTDSAALPTRPLEEFVNEIRSWLDNLLPGAIVWGYQRVGKTQGVRYLVDNAEHLLGAPIPTTLISVPDSLESPITRNQFYKLILAALGYGAPDSGTASVKKTRIEEFMVDRVRSAREHRYLMLVDEAQWLTVEQFRIFMDLHNQLKIRDIRLIVILVGQPELLDRKRALRSKGHNHLLGRFMTAIHRFEGVVDQADFVRFCRAFDEHSEWPDSSGVTFTHYFVPEAWAAGWRLQNSAVALWDVIASNRRQDNLPAKGELPMQALTALILWLLQTLHDRDDSALVLDKDTMEIAYERVASLQIRDHFMSQEKGQEE